MNEAAEIKRAISQVKHYAKEERAVQRAFEDGQTAQLSGKPLPRCQLKLPARRNAWERGWLDAERKRENLTEPKRTMIHDALALTIYNHYRIFNSLEGSLYASSKVGQQPCNSYSSLCC